MQSEDGLILRSRSEEVQTAPHRLKHLVESHHRAAGIDLVRSLEPQDPAIEERGRDLVG